MKRNEKHVRQGDVGLLKVAKVDVTGLAKIEPINGLNILAYGEATGHHHSCVDERTKLYRLNDTTMLLRVLDEVELEHQEHAFIVLQPGDYEVHGQVEYDPEGERRVQD